MKQQVKFSLFVLGSFLIMQVSHAQKSDIGNWFIYFGSQQVSKKWNWWNEVQYRNYNFAGDLEQLLLRTGLGYNLSENNNNLLLGYAFIYGEPYIGNTGEKGSTREHRIYQQFITRQKFGRVYIQHRYRLEERFLEDDFRMRFRYFLALNIPINKPAMEKNAFYFSAYNEIFLHLDKPVFDRDRVYGALGYVINNNFRAEIGMMTQIQETTSRAQFQVVLFNNLPLYKN
jgi:hypothetical protein